MVKVPDARKRDPAAVAHDSNSRMPVPEEAAAMLAEMVLVSPYTAAKMLRTSVIARRTSDTLKLEGSMEVGEKFITSPITPEANAMRIADWPG
jgi:hypothetical protein